MLDRDLSMRRGTHDDDDNSSNNQNDESKPKKDFSIITHRITNYFTRTGYICPIIVIALIILIIGSYFVGSGGDLLCVSSVSSFDRLSRNRFFGLDGLESDFGTLGVPWCKFLN
ncbi:hypothetical protein Tco_0698686 [Tanacetum coccineum]